MIRPLAFARLLHQVFDASCEVVAGSGRYPIGLLATPNERVELERDVVLLCVVASTGPQLSCPLTALTEPDLLSFPGVIGFHRLAKSLSTCPRVVILPTTFLPRPGFTGVWVGVALIGFDDRPVEVGAEFVSRLVPAVAEVEVLDVAALDVASGFGPRSAPKEPCSGVVGSLHARALATVNTTAQRAARTRLRSAPPAEQAPTRVVEQRRSAERIVVIVSTITRDSGPQSPWFMRT